MHERISRAVRCIVLCASHTCALATGRGGNPQARLAPVPSKSHPFPGTHHTTPHCTTHPSPLLCITSPSLQTSLFFPGSASPCLYDPPRSLSSPLPSPPFVSWLARQLGNTACIRPTLGRSWLAGVRRVLYVVLPSRVPPNSRVWCDDFTVSQSSQSMARCVQAVDGSARCGVPPRAVIVVVHFA